jgi:hypothetical protein
LAGKIERYSQHKVVLDKGCVQWTEKQHSTPPKLSTLLNHSKPTITLNQGNTNHHESPLFGKLAIFVHMKIPKVETLIIIVFMGSVAAWAASKCSAKRTDFVRHVREIGGEEREERPTKGRDTLLPRPAAQQPPNTSQQQAPPVNTQSPSPTPKATPPVAANPISTEPTSTPTRPSLSNQPNPTSTPAPTATAHQPTLYVTIDSLKVRKEPGLKGEPITKLRLYEPVIFLNQKTDWTQEINFGNYKATDHWVKIRTQSGKEGWVFGAGVHYYKMKRQTDR